MGAKSLGVWLVLMFAAVMATVTSPGTVAAAEQRCNELGSNCICSEPLNTATYTGGPDFWNPADSTTKECAAEAVVPGGAVIRTSPTIVGSNDTTALSRLPNGHKVSRFVRANDNHEGTFFVGNGAPIGSNITRLAARWYVYHSPNFAFKTDAGSPCQNTKVAELNGGALIDYTAGFHTYNYVQFSPSVDCCVSGPGPNANISPSQMQGKWWRWEVVLTKRSGPGFRLMMYGKNVTDNQPEVTIIDLAANSSVANLTPPALMSTITSNNHRWSPSGNGCAGFRGISHYMMAGWTSDAGQRIGAAVEIESGGGGGSTDSLPPSAPSNPRIQ